MQNKYIIIKKMLKLNSVNHNKYLFIQIKNPSLIRSSSQRGDVTV